jgi:ketosteroid isomerase-like protein
MTMGDKLMMRISCLIITLAVVSVVQTPLRAADRSTPQKTLQQWCEAVKAGTLERVLACYEDGDDVVVILSWGVMRTGIADVRREYESAFNEVVFENVELRDLSVRETEQVAWAVARFQADTTRRSDQSKWRLVIRTSYVLKQTDDGWKIVFEHSSPIAGVDRATRRNDN